MALAHARLDGAPEHVATLEASAMAFIRSQDYAAADRCLSRSRSLTSRAEDLARLEFLTGRVAHARHQYAAALDCFARAADYAVRAGAVLEEATYLSGVAASATELGQLGRALHASGRALILYEFLGHPERAARAALSRASVLLVANAREEAAEAAEEALRLAQLTGDVRCQAYSHLALAEARIGEPSSASGHLARSKELIGTDTSADDLRVAALELELGRDIEVSAYDLRASDATTSAEARIAWWGARARQLSRPGAPGRGADVVQRLTLLVSSHASVGVRGPAFAAGARLAALLGDGELSRRFARLAIDSLATLRASAPRELAASLELAPWTLGLDAPATLHVAPEQVRDVDTLVRALTNRTSLRSLLNQVLDALVLWTGVERGLLLLTAPGGRLVPRAARNLLRADLRGPQLELSYSLAERAIATREPVVAVDAAGELPELHDSVHALKLRSVLAMPLFFEGETLGVVYLDDRVRRAPSARRSWPGCGSSPRSPRWRSATRATSCGCGARRDGPSVPSASWRVALNRAKLGSTWPSSRSRTAPERTRFRYDHIVGESAAVQHLLALLDRVTATDVPVLVLGESGSGKELVARALHENGAPQGARLRVRKLLGDPRDAARVDAVRARARRVHRRRRAAAPGCSRWPTTARCSWTRSAR